MTNECGRRKALCAFPPLLVLVPYTEYKTLRKERKAWRHADLNAERSSGGGGLSFQGAFAEADTRKVMSMTALCADFALLGDVVNALEIRLNSACLGTMPGDYQMSSSPDMKMTPGSIPTPRNPSRSP